MGYIFVELINKKGLHAYSNCRSHGKKNKSEEWYFICMIEVATCVQIMKSIMMMMNEPRGGGTPNPCNKVDVKAKAKQ